MSAKLWVEIVCHDCARTGPGRFVYGNRIPVREMTAEALRDDWRQRTSGDYECPVCTKNHLKRVAAMANEVRQ